MPSVSVLPLNLSGTIFVGGRAETFYESLMEDTNFFAFGISGQQVTFTNEATTGSLRFKFRLIGFDGCVIERCLCVTPTQQFQGFSMSVPMATKRLEVVVTSTDPTDTGVPVTIVLGTVAFGKISIRKGLHKEKKGKICCKPARCGRTRAPVLPCPVVNLTSIFPNPAPLDTSNYRITGTQLAVLSKCASGCALYPTLQNEGTLTQGILSTPVELTPSSVDVVTIFVFPNNTVFVPGPATFILTPVNPACEPIVVPFEFVASAAAVNIASATVVTKDK